MRFPAPSNLIGDILLILVPVVSRIGSSLQIVVDFQLGKSDCARKAIYEARWNSDYPAVNVLFEIAFDFAPVL